MGDVLPVDLPDPTVFALEHGRDPEPEGWRYAWREDTVEGWHTWRPVEGEKTCRFDSTSRTSPRCQAPAVAELDRAVAVGDPPRWWAYCAEHLYGRLWHAGRVFSVILEAAEPSS